MNGNDDFFEKKTEPKPEMNNARAPKIYDVFETRAGEAIS